MKIGIIKESAGENRVALLPEGVKVLLGHRAEVLVEKGAGEGASVSDEKYKEIGATVTDREGLLKQSELLLMVASPGIQEIKKIRKGTVVIAAVNPLGNHELVTAFKEAGVSLFSLDVIPRTTRAQAMDILSSQATVAGYKAVLDAANKLPGFLPMFMSAAGTIKPSKILVLGAGVAGLQAIATSKKLGAVVEVFDVRSAVKEEVESLGGKFVEVEGAVDDKAAGGYAVEQTDEFKARQAQVIHDHCVKADIVIATAQIPGRKAPILVRKETVEEMQAGSVIVDLAASTGGNCELTKNDEEVEVHGVKIVGESNYPSGMPKDASFMFGKNILNFVKLIINEDGKLILDWEDDLVAGTCVTHDGEVKHERVLQFMNQ